MYEYAWKYRLTLTDGEEGEITSASGYENMMDIMDQVLLCIELCLDFPFESKYPLLQ